MRVHLAEIWIVVLLTWVLSKHSHLIGGAKDYDMGGVVSLALSLSGWALVNAYFDRRRRQHGEAA